MHTRRCERRWRREECALLVLLRVASKRGRGRKRGKVLMI
jgi:hypothetical protein